MGEKPHWAWYSGYRGVGALEPARKNTTIDACSKNAARADNRKRIPDTGTATLVSNAGEDMWAAPCSVVPVF
jgi:hypothetical protein